MTLPANDVFSLGLIHDDSTRRSTTSRSRSLTRSPSPKIPFSSSKPTSRVDRGLARRASKRVNAHANGNGHAAVHQCQQSGETKSLASPLEEIEEKREDSPVPVKYVVNWEIPRKLLHSSIGFVTLYLYCLHGSIRAVVVVLATVLVTVIVPADAIRLHYPQFERFYEKCVGFLMRESERKSTNGVIWYILGVLVVLSCYPQDIAVVSILILSWADTNASTFGRLWGRYTPALPSRLFGLPLARRKSLAGFLAASITGGVTAALFWGAIAPRALHREVIWSWDEGVVGLGRNAAGDVVGDAIKAGMAEIGVGAVHTGGWVGLGVIGIVAGLVSGIAEALDLGALDDNLTLPIISGGCLWGFFKLAGYISS